VGSYRKKSSNRGGNRAPRLGNVSKGGLAFRSTSVVQLLGAARGGVI